MKPWDPWNNTSAIGQCSSAAGMISRNWSRTREAISCRNHKSLGGDQVKPLKFILKPPDTQICMYWARIIDKHQSLYKL